MADRQILRFCLKFHLFPGFGMRKRKRIGKKRNIFDPKLLRALHRRTSDLPISEIPHAQAAP